MSEESVSPAALKRSGVPRVILLSFAAALLGAAAYVLLTPPAPEALPAWNRPVLGCEILPLAGAITCVVMGMVLLRVTLYHTRARMMRALRRFLTSLVSSCLAVVALDLVLSLFPGLQYSFMRTEDIWFYGHPSLVEDARYGWKGKANSAAFYTFDLAKKGDLTDLINHDRRWDTGEKPFSANIELDANGFVNPAVPEKADVIIVGDSFAVNGYGSGIKHWSDLVMDEMGCPTYNIAQPAWEPWREYMALVEFGLPKKPRLVLWAFYEGNDLIEIESFNEFKTLQAQKRFTWTDYVAYKGMIPPRRFPYDRPVTMLLLHLARIFNPPSEPDPECFNPVTLKTGGKDTHHAVSPYSFYYLMMPESHLKEWKAWRLAEELLKRAIEACRRNDTEFVLIYIPCKSRVYLPLIEEQTDRESFYRFVSPTLPQEWRKGPDCLMDSLHRNGPNLAYLLREFCNEESAAFIDTTDALAEAARAGEFPYYCYDTHFNEKGHAIAARAILRGLGKQGLVRETED